MVTNYKKQWEEFKKLSFKDRREIVIGILESFRGQGETFDLVYEYIIQGTDVSDRDLQDVYDSLVATAFQVDKEKETQTIGNLEMLRSKAILMREQEEKERRLTANEASLLVDTI